MGAIRAEEGSTETISHPKYTNLMASEDLSIRMDFTFPLSVNNAVYYVMHYTCLPGEC